MGQKTKLKHIRKDTVYCEDISAICIEKEKINGYFKKNNRENIGFKAILNLDKFVPIGFNQFSNSLEFELSTEENNKPNSLRKLTTVEEEKGAPLLLFVPNAQDHSQKAKGDAWLNSSTSVQHRSTYNSGINTTA